MDNRQITKNRNGGIIIMEWLQNIGQWITEHLGGITAAVSGITATSVVANIWSFIKSKKTTIENSMLMKDLKASLLENENVKKAVDSVTDLSTKLKEKIDIVEKRANDILNQSDIVVTKVNAMLDVQSLVYQTIKDEKTRVAVNNILTNAKYAVTEQRAKLLEELNNLKDEITKQNEANKSRVEETVNKAVSIVEAVDTETNVVTRG